MGQQRSDQFKHAAVQKYHNRGTRNVGAIAEELGVSSWSLYQWAKRYGTSPGMKKSDRRPQDWTAAEKLKAVVEFEGLAAEKRGEFLRREGLHTDHIEAWKKSMQASLEPGASGGAQGSKAEMSELKSRNKELERDLHRKDRALAETTALLVLKKKADLIWGTGENE